MELTASKDEATGRWNIPELEPSEKTFERMCEMLRTDHQFKFARYGDGEFFCMAGKVGKNCDKHEYFPDLGEALRDAYYSDPQYMVGIQPLSISNELYKKKPEMLSEIAMLHPVPKNIYNADVLHNASIDGKLPELFKALTGRPFVVVGPAHLSNIGRHIRIPDINCWLQYDEVREMISYCLSYRYLDSSRRPVFLLCASMMSEVLIHDFRHADATFIDCGSVFDPYYGKLSRSYHHKLKL